MDVIHILKIPILLILWNFQVGTSLGATKGLLLRGGNVLEKFAMVDTIVFDKTGTLTIGRPVVTKVVTQAYEKIIDSKLSADRKVPMYCTNSF